MTLLLNLQPSRLKFSLLLTFLFLFFSGYSQLEHFKNTKTLGLNAHKINGKVKSIEHKTLKYGLDLDSVKSLKEPHYSNLIKREFDSLGRLTDHYFFRSDSSHYRYTYDLNNRLEETQYSSYEKLVHSYMDSSMLILHILENKQIDSMVYSINESKLIWKLESYKHNGDPKKPSTRIYEYDSLSNLIKVNAYSTSGLWLVATYSYDEKNQLIKKTTANAKGRISNQFEIGYNELGHFLWKKVKDGSIRSWKYTVYDEMDNWIERINYNNDRPVSKTYRTIVYR